MEGEKSWAHWEAESITFLSASFISNRITVRPRQNSPRAPLDVRILFHIYFSFRGATLLTVRVSVARTRHSRVGRMGASLHFPLVLFLLCILFSSHARAQWLSLFWATPKVSTTSPPLSSAVTVTAAATTTSAVPTTGSAAEALGFRVDHAHVEASVPPSPAAVYPSAPPVEGGVGRSSAQQKPLRQWKSGEETLSLFSLWVHFYRGARSSAWNNLFWGKCFNGFNGKRFWCIEKTNRIHYSSILLLMWSSQLYFILLCC